MAAPPPSSIAFVVRGPLVVGDLPALAREITALLERSEPSLALCRLCGVQADLVAVDALARLRLIARRHGCPLIVRGASAALRELFVLAGLEDVLAG
jgi:ABC-type transporter Mla MlaB component